jgi:hypothetical protein
LFVVVLRYNYTRHFRVSQKQKGILWGQKWNKVGLAGRFLDYPSTWILTISIGKVGLIIDDGCDGNRFRIWGNLQILELENVSPEVILFLESPLEIAPMERAGKERSALIERNPEISRNGHEENLLF